MSENRNPMETRMKRLMAACVTTLAIGAFGLTLARADDSNGIASASAESSSTRDVTPAYGIFRAAAAPLDAAGRIDRVVGSLAARSSLDPKLTRAVELNGASVTVFAGPSALCVASAEPSGEAGVGCATRAAKLDALSTGVEPGALVTKLTGGYRVTVLLPDGARGLTLTTAVGTRIPLDTTSNLASVVSKEAPQELSWTAPDGTSRVYDLSFTTRS
jgi:hypothetical protein